MPPRLALPAAPAVLALIAVAFVVPGLAHHDPWKSVDAIAIAIVHGMHLGGDWLVPHLAGVPWLEDPPLYHWAALAFGELLGGLLAFHDAARLASGMFVLAAFYFTYRAARSWSADGSPDAKAVEPAAAVLLLIGAIGLMVHAHEALPELGALAATAAVLACLAAAPGDSPARAATRGMLLGIALAAAFLSTGLVTALALAATCLLAPLVCAPLRTPQGWTRLATAAVVALLLCALWPAALALRAPEALALWWSLATQPQGSVWGNLRFFVVATSWFAWPAWLLAGWTLWCSRRRLGEPRLFVPLAASLLIFAAAVIWGPARDFNMLAVLPPLALLAAPGLAKLRRGAAAALDWFGLMTFALFTGLVWLGYVAMMTGVPPRVAHNFAKLAPGFVPHFEPAALIMALLLTLGWLYVAFFAAPSPARGPLRWAAGVTVLWACFSLLWLNWADHQRSYRGVAAELRTRLPPKAACIAETNLGIAQRAAFSYHAGIVTQPFDPARPRACPVLLVQGRPGDANDAPGPGWVRLVEASRPNDKTERYRLYRAPR